MLKELKKIKIEKGELSFVNVIHINEEVTINTCSSNSKTSFDQEINELEKAFGKLQRLTNKKQNPTSFTKNWYFRPTPLDMQFEERNFQH